MKLLRIAAGCLVGLALVGCVDTPQQQNQAVATAAGAAIGAGLGMAASNEADEKKGALVGGGVGALLGNLAAQRLSAPAPQPNQTAAAAAPAPRPNAITDPRQRAIQSAHEYAVQQALGNNSIQNWSASGANGTIYPTGTWTEHGLTCRSYDSNWREGRQSGTVTARACRQPDGYWK